MLYIGNVKTLILRNNALTSIKGLEKLMGLEMIDLTENVLIEIDEIQLLAELPFLKAVTFFGIFELSDIIVRYLII